MRASNLNMPFVTIFNSKNGFMLALLFLPRKLHIPHLAAMCVFITYDRYFNDNELSNFLYAYT